MKRIVIGIAGVAVLLLVIALIVPFFLPKDTIKREIVAQVEQATGWRLRLDGPVGLSLLPSFSLSARDVGLSDKAGAEEFAKVGEIDFGLSLGALIGGTARITGITLVEPKILLAANGSSAGSRRTLSDLIDQSLSDAVSNASSLPPLPSEDRRSLAEPAPVTAEPATEAGNDLADLMRRVRIDKLRVVDGEVAFAGASGDALFSAINMTLALLSPEEAATLEGSLAWGGSEFEIEAEVGSPLALAERKASEVTATVEGAFGKATVSGTVAAQPMAGSLRIAIAGDSLANALTALQMPVDGVSGLDAYEITATTDIAPTLVTLDELSASLGGTTLTGRAVLDLTSRRPALGASLAVDAIDLDRFRQPVKAETDGTNTDGAGKSDTASLTNPGPSSSAAPAIDLSPLSAFDANVAIGIGNVSGAGIVIDGMRANAKVSNGRLDLDLAEVTAFGGSGLFQVSAEPAGQGAAVSGTLRANGFDLGQLAAFAGRSEPATGRLSANVSFAGQGTTPDALARALKTEGSISLAGGSLDGLPLEDVAGGDPAAGKLDNIDVDVRFAGLDGPASIKGGVTWRGERFALAGNATPAALVAGRPVPVDASLSSSRVTLGANGTASLGGDFDGQLSLKTPDLRGLLAWMGRPMAPGKGLRNFAVSGRLEASRDRLAFREATIALDGSSGTGNGAVSLAGPVPTITATLALDQLVLDPYLGGRAEGGGSNGGGSKGATSAGASGGGWSREPIDFSGLQAANADLAITAKTIRWDELTIGQTKLAVALQGGRLKADLDPMNLYEGGANGSVTIDSTAAQPAVAAAFELSGLEAHGFLTDLAGFRALHGRAAIGFNVTASGASEAAMMSSLSGTARAKFTNGSIRGINIPQMVRGLSAATLLGWGNSGDEQATDFSELSASFAIDKGVARNDDLALIGPLVRVTGGGTTDIGNRTLDWRVEPKIVASLKGQGVQDDELVGLGVPVVIRGSWDKPQIYPDIAGILENPDEAYKKLQAVSGGLLEALKKDPGKAVSETVKQLTGGNGSGAFDIRKVIEGEVDDEDVLKSIEEGFKTAPNLFGLGGKKKKKE